MSVVLGHYCVWNLTGPRPGVTATPVALGQLCTVGNIHLKRVNVKELCQSRFNMPYLIQLVGAMTTNHNIHIHEIFNIFSGHIMS